MERLLQGGIDCIEVLKDAVMAIALLARHSRTTLTSLKIRLEENPGFYELHIISSKEPRTTDE